jgi:hypothetical protein
VAMRECPQCMKKVPATAVVAYTNSMECPHCQALLTVALPTRVIGAFIGLGVGWLVYGWAQKSLTGDAAWMLPTLYAFLAYSFIYTIYVMTTADLVMRQAEIEAPTLAVTPAAAHGHDGGHH